MATVHRDVLIDVGPEEVWAAIRDWGEVHHRLAPGFVVDTRVEGDVRVVTFADGTVVRELIVSLDDEARRIAYSVVGGSLDVVHHHASMQVFAKAGGRIRFVWITDVKPHSLAEPIAAMVDQGIRVIQRTLEAAAASAS
ncbi:SRPBCC family protein [Streptomyces sp. NPDC059460]|uniref:SRPBCC family protein n=1 Tax=Streptomyces sp. NPDC059460 TaxID=3346840 RepID=UPI0036C42170